MNDQQSTGACQKEDFVDAVFESIKDMRASEKMSLVNAISSEYDQLVNYEDFLNLVYRYGNDYAGNEFKFQQMSAGKMNEARQGTGITPENRVLISKLKQNLQQCNVGMTGVEPSLRKFGSQGGVSITQDELLIALSRVDAAVTLEEIKEFYSIV